MTYPLFYKHYFNCTNTLCKHYSNASLRDPSISCTFDSPLSLLSSIFHSLAIDALFLDLSTPHQQILILTQVKSSDFWIPLAFTVLKQTNKHTPYFALKFTVEHFQS